VLKLVVRANARRDKVPVLLALREELEELKVLLRLCQDVKAFANFNSFEHAITQVTDIAKQTLRYALRATQGDRGWLKSQRQGFGPTGAGQNRKAMPDGLAAPSVPPSIRALERWALLGILGRAWAGRSLRICCAARMSRTTSAIPTT
jgi:hypothetical protein